MFKSIGYIILKLGLSIVFLYFGFNQLINPSNWTIFLPNFISSSNLAILIIYLNSLFDIFIGISFLFGFLIKLTSILAFLHLLAITFFALGINSASGIRDLGLAFAALSLFFLRD